MSSAERPSVAVTGIGLVTPHAAGGREDGARERSVMIGGKRSPLAGGSSSPVENFDAPSILGRRGLRHLTRGTLFLLAASRLALRDAGLDGEKVSAGEDVGVAVGTMTGNADLVVGFDRTILDEGPSAVNPALFPQTVWNSSSSHVAIRFGLEGLNTTLSTGLNSGHEALLEACRTLGGGRERVMIGGGFEELTPSFKPLLPARAGSAERWPGSEGAAVLILEREEEAVSRGASPMARLRGGRSSFFPRAAGDDEDFAAFRKSLLEAALEDANCVAERVRRLWAVTYPSSPRNEEGGPSALWPFEEGPPPVVHLPSLAGCSGGLTGALAAALAAAPGGGPGSAEGECELVISEDGLGRLAVLVVERA